MAIKVLAPHLGSSGAARKRFSREAQAAAAVVHDNVMEIHGVADAAGLPYLVMPYVRGPSLQRRLDGEGPLALVEILRIGMQAAAGLAAAHAQGLVHRDVKPANILLADGVERVKLTDFGLARAADDASLTKTGIIAGTPQYMSPEQARGESVDQRSDLFSLGSVLYAMCTGRAPFRAETSYGVLRRITDEEPRPIREINPDIPEWLCRIVAKLMSKQPDDRFQSAREVAELLEECLAHVQQPTAVPLPAQLATQSRRGRFSSISRRWKGAIAMIATLGLGLLAVALMQATEPPDIAGQWTGEGWGNVVLKMSEAGQYTGSYDDPANKQSGDLNLSWSRLQQRFNGTWRESGDRFGELSIRLVGREIRGARTIDAKSKIDPATPRLADLVWTRPEPTAIGIKPAGQTKPAGEEPKREHHFQIAGPVYKIACTADGKLVAITSGPDEKPSVKILDAETGNPLASLKLTTDDEEAALNATRMVLRSDLFGIGPLAFSPDGGLVAVGFSVGQVKLFNTRTGELVQTLDDEQGRLAARDTPETLKSFKRAMGSVTSLAFSPDGSLLATGGRSFGDDDVSGTFTGVSSTVLETTGPGRLKVWDVKAGTVKYDLAGHRCVSAVAFSPDGNLLASAGDWGCVVTTDEEGAGVILWNPHTGAKVRTITQLSSACAAQTAVAFSPDGELLAIALGILNTQKEDSPPPTMLSVVPVSPGAPLWQHIAAGWVDLKGFSPDGRTVAAFYGGESITVPSEDGSESPPIWFLDAETGQEADAIPVNDSLPAGQWNFVAPAATGRRLAITATDAEKHSVVDVWIMPTSYRFGPLSRTTPAHPASPAKAKTPPAAPAAKPQNPDEFSLRFGGAIKRVGRFQPDLQVQTVACSPDGKLIAVGNDAPGLFQLTSGEARLGDEKWRPLVEVLNAETGNRIVSLKLTTEDEDKMLAAASDIWQANFGPDRVPYFLVKSLAFSPDGSLLAVGTSVGQVKLFNAQTGELVQALDDQEGKAADKKTIESARPLKRAMGSVVSLAFSPDGSLLAMAGKSFDDMPLVADKDTASDYTWSFAKLPTAPGRLKVWNVATGKLKYDLLGHGHANGVAFSPDGNFLASAGSWLNENEGGKGVTVDGEGAIIWSAWTGAKLRTITRPPSRGTHSVAFSPDSKLVAIGSRTHDHGQAVEGPNLCVAEVLSPVTLWQQSSSLAPSPWPSRPTERTSWSVATTRASGSWIRRPER